MRSSHVQTTPPAVPSHQVKVRHVRLSLLLRHPTGGLLQVLGAAHIPRPPAARTRCTAAPPAWSVTWRPPGVSPAAISFSCQNSLQPQQSPELASLASSGWVSTKLEMRTRSFARTTRSLALMTRPAATSRTGTGAAVPWAETRCVALTGSTAVLTSLSVTSRLAPALLSDSRHRLCTSDQISINLNLNWEFF